MNNKIYIRLLLVLVLIAGILSAWHYIFSYQKVPITIDSGLQAYVYKHGSESDTYSGKADLTVDHSGSFRLKKGDYALVFRGNQDYAASLQLFSLNGKKVNLSVHPDYSEQRITELLKTIQPVIDRSLKTAYPTQMQSYTIQNATLYNRGEWYAANLAYHGDDPYDADTLKVVLHNVNNAWEVSTKPPDISLSAAIYPTIPKDILSKTNRL